MQSERHALNSQVKEVTVSPEPQDPWSWLEHRESAAFPPDSVSKSDGSNEGVCVSGGG